MKLTIEINEDAAGNVVTDVSQSEQGSAKENAVAMIVKIAIQTLPFRLAMFKLEQDGFDLSAN